MFGVEAMIARPKFVRVAAIPTAILAVRVQLRAICIRPGKLKRHRLEACVITRSFSFCRLQIPNLTLSFP